MYKINVPVYNLKFTPDRTTPMTPLPPANYRVILSRLIITLANFHNPPSRSKSRCQCGTCGVKVITDTLFMTMACKWQFSVNYLLPIPHNGVSVNHTENGCEVTCTLKLKGVCRKILCRWVNYFSSFQQHVEKSSLVGEPIFWCGFQDVLMFLYSRLLIKSSLP